MGHWLNLTAFGSKIKVITRDMTVADKLLGKEEDFVVNLIGWIN